MLRFHYHKPRELWENLRDLSLARTNFTSQLTEVPSVKQFITDDEIDAAMIRGGGFAGSKAEFSPFSRNHIRIRKRWIFSNTSMVLAVTPMPCPVPMKSDESHDGKGQHYKKDGCPDVHFTWEKVASGLLT